MTKRYIPRPLLRRLSAEAHGRCAYCRAPTSITGARLVVDHIIPEAADGRTEFENLCLACHSCNEFKGALVGSEDLVTGNVVALYNPRLHRQKSRQRELQHSQVQRGTSQDGSIGKRQLNRPIAIGCGVRNLNETTPQATTRVQTTPQATTRVKNGPTVRLRKA